MQRSVPTIGWTSRIQRQPGCMIMRPMTKSSSSKISVAPFVYWRTSSGCSIFLC